jgi:hypothetical protein
VIPIIPQEVSNVKRYGFEFSIFARSLPTNSVTELRTGAVGDAVHHPRMGHDDESRSAQVWVDGQRVVANGFVKAVNELCYGVTDGNGGG